jgi:hypothetical protein
VLFRSEQAIPSNIRQVGFEHEQSGGKTSGQQIQEQQTEGKPERPISTIILNDSMTRRLVQNTPTTEIVEPLRSAPVVSAPLPEPPPQPQADPRYQFNKTETMFPDKVF